MAKPMPEKVWTPESLQSLADAHYAGRPKGFSWFRLRNDEYRVIAEAATAVLRAQLAAVTAEREALDRIELYAREIQGISNSADIRGLAHSILDEVAAVRKAASEMPRADALGEVGEMVRFEQVYDKDRVTFEFTHGHPLRFADGRVRVSKVEP